MPDVLPDPASSFGARVRRRLREERVVWLTTTGSDGTPQPNPVWFLWDDPDTMVVYSRSDARRLDHISANALVALHFDGDGQGGDIVVFLGRATLTPELPSPHANRAYVDKYGDSMVRVSGSVEAFSDAYPVALSVRVERVRGH